MNQDTLNDIDSTELQAYAQAFAFLGNSFLAPVGQTEPVGLSPEFWQAFPSFGGSAVQSALSALVAYADELANLADAGTDPIKEVSAEHAKLFLGPPRPAAAPWETFYVGEGKKVGFGRPTVEMQDLLREAGLEVGGQNNQYADHIGIELLYLSVLCDRAAQARAANVEIAEQMQAARTFVAEHPLSWVGALQEKVDAVFPQGYYHHLLVLVAALLNQFVSE